MGNLIKNMQIIKCRCGKCFAACVEPECYTDKEWVKELRKYVLAGCTVEIVPCGCPNFEDCDCNKTKNEIKQKELFDA
jgi:hypothetical protein